MAGYVWGLWLHMNVDRPPYCRHCGPGLSATAECAQQILGAKPIGATSMAFLCHSSYICIQNCRGEYLLLHACLYDSYLPQYFLPGPFLLVLFFHA